MDSVDVEQAKPNTLDEQSVKRFVENWKIKEEDLPVVEELGQFDSEFYARNFHNYFLNSLASKGVTILERDIAETEKRIPTAIDERHKKQLEDNLTAFKLFKDITEKYSWRASYSLVTAMEGRQRR